MCLQFSNVSWFILSWTRRELQCFFLRRTLEALIPSASEKTNIRSKIMRAHPSSFTLHSGSIALKACSGFRACIGELRSFSIVRYPEKWASLFVFCCLLLLWELYLSVFFAFFCYYFFLLFEMNIGTLTNTCHLWFIIESVFSQEYWRKKIILLEKVNLVRHY